MDQSEEQKASTFLFHWPLLDLQSVSTPFPSLELIALLAVPCRSTSPLSLRPHPHPPDLRTLGSLSRALSPNSLRSLTQRGCWIRNTCIDSYRLVASDWP